MYLLGQSGELVPVGVAGELCIGGAGLGRGYLGRAELTAERWVPDGVSGREGERLYRTGDLARWTLAGTLEFLGRLDQQVKIRGFRVEPGEVESVLARHPGVREVSVGVVGGGAERRLVAWVSLAAGEPEATRDGLRELLRAHLPEPMVPSLWYCSPSLPLTANGKVDRAALAERTRTEPVGGRGSSRRRAPRWRSFWPVCGRRSWGVARVGWSDDFFELGGHSLLATQLASRVRSLLGRRAAAALVFRALAAGRARG